MPKLTISLVTVVFNAVDTIADTIESVRSQTYSDIEHIVIDGGSTDGTLEVIDSYTGINLAVVSEPDSGIYDAMNKGISAATGEVIGFLNSDDVFNAPDVLNKIAIVFNTQHVKVCFGDIVFVRDDLETIVRFYRSNNFTPDQLKYGQMPANPSLYFKRSLFKEYGCYKTDYRIASDFELVARLFYRHNVTYCYIPEVFVKMRVGGISTAGIRSSIILNWEIIRACRENSINTNLFKLLSKIPSRLFELYSRPDR